MELTAEVHFAQRLASNQQKLRDKTLKKVGTWLATKSVNNDAFSEDSLLKLWKGLFYYFWHTDKPLIQEEKADVICSYIHDFQAVEGSFLYIDTFFQTMTREWIAIDRYRLEKFMMLVRKFLHQTYQLLKKLNWKLKWIKRFRKVMKKSVMSGLSTTTPVGLKMHLSDMYMEELAKVGADEVSPDILQQFLIPYCRILIESEDSSFLESVSKDVFLYLINQNVDEAEFHEFPILNFDANAVQSLLLKYANKPGVKKPNMKVIYSIIKEFEDYKNGVNAMDKIFSDKSSSRRLRKRTIEKAAISLVEDEIAYSQEKKKVKKKKLKEDDDIIDL